MSMNITPELIAAAKRVLRVKNREPVEHVYAGDPFPDCPYTYEEEQLAAWAAHALPKLAEIVAEVKRLRAIPWYDGPYWSSRIEGLLRMIESELTQ
jgi:NAD(P)H-dependent FMN reductase